MTEPLPDMLARLRSKGWMVPGGDVAWVSNEVLEDARATEQEIEWAHKVLDVFTVPRTIHNPYDHCDVGLNVAGRIQAALNPRNEDISTVKHEDEDAERAAVRALIEAAEFALDNSSGYLPPYDEERIRNALVHPAIRRLAEQP